MPVSTPRPGRAPAPAERPLAAAAPLLLALGDSACGALAAAGRPGARPIRDEISCGPLTALEGPAANPGGDADWIAARAGFWDGVLSAAPGAAARSPALAAALPPERMLAADLAALRAGLRAAGEIVFAMGASAQEILALAFLARVAAQEGALARLSAQVHAGAAEMEASPAQGLAALPRATLAEAPPPRPVAPMAGALDEIWRAVVAPDPADLARLAARGPAAWPLPGIAAALGSRLLRFPDAETGLAREDALLLAAAGDDWAPPARIVSAALAANAGPDRLGDLWLLRLLAELADPAAAPPALEWRGASRDPLRGGIRRTEFGRRLAAGAAFRLSEGRFARWIGGARLDLAAGRGWLREGPNLVPLRP